MVLATTEIHARILPGHPSTTNHGLFSTSDKLQMKSMDWVPWVPWDHMLATGHSVLDADHKYLVTLVNQLADSVKERKGKLACGNLLDKIIEHTKAHFEVEERLMAEHRYHKADEHTADHARLIKQALNYRSKFEVGSPGSHIALIHFPEDWLTFHILAADKELADFLSATG
jgi:hemerythrin